MKHYPPPEPLPRRPEPLKHFRSMVRDREVYVVAAVVLICFVIAVMAS